MEPADLEFVMSLELELVAPDVRADAHRLDQLLHDDFVEVGATGRNLAAAELIDDLLATPLVDEITVSELAARPLAGDDILVTYRTSTTQGVVVRNSLWRRGRRGWQLVVHQGTPVPSS
jgi:ribonuclease HI